MVKLGRKVLELVCEEIHTWPVDNQTRLKVAVNISAVELLQPDFIQVLFETLERHGVEPTLLDLELTESTLVENIDQAKAVMTCCQQRGIGAYIDDFGTGYSSLAYLRKLPLTGVKIDRSFIKRIENTNEDRSIISAIITLAHNLNLSVVAEGVEEIAQRGFLHGAPARLPELIVKQRRDISTTRG